MIRDPRDSVTSKMFLNNFDSYWQGIECLYKKIKPLFSIESIKENIVCIRYEELVNDPNDIQLKLSQKLNFKIKTKFSDCYLEFENLKENNGTFKKYVKRLMGNSTDKPFRPITNKNVGRWKQEEHKEYIKSLCKDNPKYIVMLQEMLLFYNYENDISWLSELL